MRGACECLGSFAAPNDSDGQVATLAERVLLDEVALLAESPYDGSDIDVTETRTAFCGVISVDQLAYRLETFATREAAFAAAATITHRGQCGTCSSLQDLAVYMGNTDLAGPVRRCGIETLGDGEPETRACLMKIGFTEPCAQIWAFNTIHTREKCLSVCLAELDSPYHQSDGSLNRCIQCDEDESGPVFKVVAGKARTRSLLIVSRST